MAQQTSRWPLEEGVVMAEQPATVRVIALPVVALVSIVGTLSWAAWPDSMILTAGDAPWVAWVVAPALGLLGLSVLVALRPPPTWRRLYPVGLVFLLLTLGGLWVSAVDPNASSTASLGLLVLPVFQWVVGVLGLFALLIGRDPDRERTRTSSGPAAPRSRQTNG